MTREEAARLQATHENPHFLPGVHLPEQIRFTGMEDADLSGAGLLVYAVPTQAVREVARWVTRRGVGGALQLSLAKGYEIGSLKRPTQVIEEETGAGAAALSGPNHAEEVSKDMPSATVIASVGRGLGAGARQAAITSDTFRVYTNDDVVGVEFCGAVKNPIAVAVGMSDGLGFGDNSRASLITRSVAEMTRLGMIRARTSPPSPAWPVSATSSPRAPPGTAATGWPASCWPRARRRPRWRPRWAKSWRACTPPTRSTTSPRGWASTCRSPRTCTRCSRATVHPRRASPT